MRKLLFPLVILMALSACETSEERAEKHFAAAQELLAENDVDRALVELRNVFKLNGQHREARKLFAQIQLDRGREDIAYRQYLRLVEQYPDDIDGLRVISEISLRRFDWENAERYIPRGLALVPEDRLFQAMNAVVAYRAARNDEDADAMEALVTQAEEIVAEDGSQLFARQILIDDRLSKRDLTGALEQVETSLAQEPDNLRLHEMKLRILNELQDTPAVGAHLEEMIRRFPENEQIRSLMISWYLQEGELDQAEAFLRQLAEQADDADRRDAQVAVIQFLRRTAGAEAALAEIDARIAASDNPLYFRSLRAAQLFDSGVRDEAIAELRDALDGAEASEDARTAKVALAQMLENEGDNIGARALVEEVLEQDGLQVTALQMKAAWQIEADAIAEAIQLLRTALDADPQNAQTLTMMARAHLRDGDRSLAGERLSLAVEVSNNAPDTSVRYANFLLQDGRFPPAESVLLDALRRAPNNVQVLQTLGLAYLSEADWGRTRGVIRQLERLETAAGAGVARALQTQLLLRQNRTDESITFLQGLIDQGDASLEAVALIVQTHLREGNIAEAQSFLDETIRENPDALLLRYVQAALYAASGNVEDATTAYRALIAQEPQNDAPVLALYVILRDTGDQPGATAVIDAALDRMEAPSPRLMSVKASQLEAEGDIDGAIAIYEDLYAQSTDNVVLANNLASLITTHRDDAESLERAEVIARRLRGSDIPAFQDTYGWIQYRRGNFEDAVEYLEPAAAGLPEDPMVQAHLGLAYAATEQVELARTTLTRALELAGDSPLPRYAEVREVLQNLPDPIEDADQN
ncbi:hypothetical protein So717_42570 [Roseobacter cerasinus]|uniref:TPR domain protein n=1 Tax=Roseobacter cerasinus TaxID=2602289 RepID=A0A640VY36_9RHOB|nr:tetratricopeptide repeat protein [Roseobacter cerasinus]GFE52504.1 hypothetical protein So717_42570 [Roseobacter cerasinus]